MCVDCLGELDDPRCTACKEEAPRPAPPIGGWLYLPLLGLYLSPIVFVASLLVVSAQVAPVGLDAALADGQWLAITAFDLLSTLGLTAFSLYILPKFRARKVEVPDLMQRLYALNLVSHLLTLVASASLGQVEAAEVTNFGSEAVRPVIFSLAWMMYFVKSERVKVTFVSR